MSLHFWFVVVSSFELSACSPPTFALKYDEGGLAAHAGEGGKESVGRDEERGTRVEKGDDCSVAARDGVKKELALKSVE